MPEQTFEDRFLSGRELYGDDFAQHEINEWFEDEREGYADLGQGEDGQDSAGFWYHAVNMRYGYKRLAGMRFRHALGIGSAWGNEFEQIAGQIDQLTILEPSDQLVSQQIGELEPRYVKPHPSGTMPFDDAAFDLITCFGTLHHIPNVTHVVHEMGRVVQPGGHVLIREPIISMGDWRAYRGTGLTRRERGIPLAILESAVKSAGLEIERKSYWNFPGTVRLGMALNVPTFNSPTLTMVDAIASRMLRANLRYHATTRWQKFRPTCVALELRRPR